MTLELKKIFRLQCDSKTLPEQQIVDN